MGKPSFRQCEVERLLRAAKAVGYPHPSVEKRPDGTLKLLTDPGADAADEPAANEWDVVLPQ